MLGLSTTKEEPKAKKTVNKKQDKTAVQQTANNSQSAEAKALLEQMEAKKEANPDSCMFC